MPGRTSLPGSPSGTAIAFPCGLAAFALLLLWLAVPAAIVETRLTFGDPALAAIERGLRPTAAGEARLEASRRAALALMPRADAERDLGLLELARARRTTAAGRAGADDHLVRAWGHLLRSVVAEPARPEAWYALALVRLALRGDRDGAAEALRLSYRVAPMRPTLADGRARLALLLLDGLDIHSRTWARWDLALLAREDGEGLRRWARIAGVAPLLDRMLGSELPGRPIRAARADASG